MIGLLVPNHDPVKKRMSDSKPKKGIFSQKERFYRLFLETFTDCVQHRFSILTIEKYWFSPAAVPRSVKSNYLEQLWGLYLENNS
jgi:hypothetical protein